MNRVPKLEWISLVYLALFVLAVLSPSIHTKGYFGLTETRLEELSIFLFGLAGLATFSVYERIVERRVKEKEEVEMDYNRAKKELIESYTYIGSVNRKIELLKKVTNTASLSVGDGKKLPKELFQAIAQNAAASIGADVALLRFVTCSKLRTDGEHMHASGGVRSVRVPNKDLQAIVDGGVQHAFIRSEDGLEFLCVPSDRKADTKAFMLLHLPNDQIQEIDVSLLKVFVNQADMLFTSPQGV